MSSLCGSAKIKQLSQRLRSLNSDIEEDQDSKAIDHRAECLENKLDSRSSLFESKIILLHESAIKITESIRAEKISRQLFDEQITKKIKLCKSMIAKNLARVESVMKCASGAN